MRSKYIWLVLIAVSVGGCVSGTSGTMQSQDKLSQIQKGITTRSQVETLLGSPTNVMNTPDGKTVLLYVAGQVDTQNDFSWMIPVVGGFIPQHNSSSSRMQQVDITLDANNVVEDCEVNDNTTNTNVDSSIFGGHGTSVTTPTSAPAAN
jgi:outer membrane protein assembly factor BamE (lipoprotein component of BamABCDE complex)